MSNTSRQSGAGATRFAEDDGSQQQHQQQNNTQQPNSNKGRLRQTILPRHYDRNNYCGPFGDTITKKKEDNLRVLHHNVNGISSCHDIIATETLIDVCEEMRADIIGIVEPNLNFSRASVKESFRSRLRKRWPLHHNIVSQLPTDKMSNHQMGGCLLITRGKWSSRIVSSHQDIMGRWSSITVQGRDQTQLTMITAYRPCNMTINGSKQRTIFMQQWEYLVGTGENNKTKNPREVCITDLKNFIKETRDKPHPANQSTRHGIILTWDANESLDSRNMEQFMEHTGMVEIFDVKYNKETIPSTYSRGTKKIDHIMVTPNVVPYIEACGMTGFGGGFKSDHRALFVDINVKDFLRGDVTYITPNLLRQVHTRDPRIVTEYVKNVHRYLVEHNYEERLNRLVGSRGESDISIIETLDSDMIRARRHAAKKLGKRFKAGWSPELRRSFLELQYWQTLLTSKKHPDKNYNDTLKDMQKELQKPRVTEEKTEKQIRKEIKSAAKNFDKTLKNAHELRQQYLRERAMALSITKKTSAESEIKRITAVEQTIEVFRKIRSVFKNNVKSGLSYVLYPKKDCNGNEVTDSNGKPVLETCHDLETIEHILIDRNLDHFGQAHGSPPTVEMIAELLDDGCNTFCDDVSNGRTFDTTKIPQQGLRQILQYLKKKSSTTINCEITGDDLHRGFQNWRESTTTSPSGIDLGHWRATTYHMKSNDEHNQKSTDIMRWHATLINETIRREHVLNRWKTVHSCMIEKIPGIPLISKLRVIHIFEADLNLLLGIWSRRLQWNAEKNKYLHHDQWAQKGNRAIDTAMTKKLTYAYSTLSRTDLGTLDTDAKSCYDRMIASLVNLRNIQLGMPKSAAKTQSSFLNTAKYHLKTKLGISTKHYGNTKETPQYGQGQGAKWAPMSWIGISTLLLDIISDSVSYNMKITDTKKQQLDIRQMDGYVDDFTSWTNLPNQSEDDPHGLIQSEIIITKQLQNLSQEWEHLLACTGGRLELPKCFTYILNWKFDRKGRPYLQTDTTSGLLLKDTISGNELTIDRKEPNIPHRTLGIFISPTENETLAITELNTKCNKFATLLRASGSSLSKDELRIFLYALYKPSVTYMLPATSLSKPQCHKLQSNFVRTVASALGYNRNFPRVLLHAPAYLGGANIPDIYTEQGISHILFLIRHIRGRTRVGKLIHTILDWAQTYCGISKNLLENVETPIDKYMPIRWINSIRLFLQENELSLKIKNAPTIPLRREHDRCLMEIAMAQSFSPAELQDINNCRLYLQVETLSDISSACGKFLQPTATAKNAPTGSVQEFFTSIATKLFPRQCKPVSSAWRVWLQLMKICTGEYKCALEQSLGRWETIGHRERLWTSYIRPDHNDMITRHITGTWECIPIHSEKRTARIYDASKKSTFIDRTCQYVTETWIPIDVIATEKLWVITKQLKQEELYDAQLHRISDEANFLRTWDNNLIRNLTQIILTESHIDMTATTIDNNGAYCAIIACPSYRVTLRKTDRAQGQPMTAKRTELFGIANLVTALNTLQQDIVEQEGTWRLRTVSVYVNSNKNYRALREWSCVRNNSLSQDWDILEYISNKLIEAQAKITILRLPSKKVKAPGLDLLHATIETIQKQIDSYPKAVLGEQTSHEPLTTLTIAMCNNITYVCAGAEEREIRRCVHEYAYMKYLVENKNMSPSTIQDIAWSERHTAMKGLPKNITTFIGKLAHGWLPTAQRLHEINDCPSPICQRCGKDNETIEHVFICPTASLWKEQASTVMKNLLVSDKPLNDDISFRQEILNNFTRWIQHTKNGSEQDHPTSLMKDNTDWMNCICGMIPTKWISEERFTRQEVIQMARTLIETAYSGWTSRCDQIHNEANEKEEHRTESLRDSMINEKARQLYKKGQELDVHHRQYFDFDIDQFLIGRSYRETSNWCNHTKKFIKKAKASEKRNKSNGLQQRTLPQYLTISRDKYPP